MHKKIYFSNPNGSGAEAPNEGNPGPEDIYGFDEKDD